MAADLPRARIQKADDYLKVGSFGGDNNQGEVGPGLYGFNWWFNAPIPPTGKLYWPAAPGKMFASIGWGGNYMLMFPSRSLLVAGRGYWGEEDSGRADSRFCEIVKLIIEADANAPVP